MLMHVCEILGEIKTLKFRKSGNWLVNFDNYHISFSFFGKREMKPKRKSLITAAFFLFIMSKEKQQGKKKSFCVGEVARNFLQSYLRIIRF